MTLLPLKSIGLVAIEKRSETLKTGHKEEGRKGGREGGKEGRKEGREGRKE